MKADTIRVDRSARAETRRSRQPRGRLLRMPALRVETTRATTKF